MTRLDEQLYRRGTAGGDHLELTQVNPSSHDTTSSQDVHHHHHQQHATTYEAPSHVAAGGDDEEAEGGMVMKPVGGAKRQRTKPFIIWVAVCAALGGLIFGYDIAGAGATFVMNGFQLHFHWKCPNSNTNCTPKTKPEIQHDQGNINGLFGLGATVGAITIPILADKRGRRPCLAAACVIFSIGTTLQCTAATMHIMWLGRVFSGYAIGALSMCAPVYIAECAPEHARGMLGTLWQLAITVGVLLASAANLQLMHYQEGWRVSYGGNLIFAFFLLGALWIMPESPRWIAAHGTDRKLYDALMLLRYQDEIASETVQLHAEVQEEKTHGSAAWSEVFCKENNMRYRLVLGISLQAIQQLCGINAIMFYAPEILKEFFGEEDAIYGTFVLNVMNFLATLIAVALVDSAGRVKLLVSGGTIMFVALLANSTLAAMEQTRAVGYQVLFFASLFIVGFAYSWGPIVWLVCSEMFPLRTRGKATGVTTMTNWLCTTLVGAVFPVLSSWSLAGCFRGFALAIFGGVWMVYFLQAETGGLNILEIDEAFRSHCVRWKRSRW